MQDLDAILIAGPTASGKTKLGIELSRSHNAPILNADSMQVYADLRIVTARPSAEEEAAAPHHLFGHVNAATRYSTGEWLRDVERLLRELPRPLIFLGGTGLYFDALMGGLSPVPPVPRSVVEGLEARLAAEGLEALIAELKAVDADLCQQLEVLDAQRVLRALSVYEATGKPLSAWQKETPPPLIDLSRTRKMVILPERETLYARINARVENMIEEGALQEVEALLARNLDPSLTAMKAIGVPELGAYLRGECDLPTATDKMAQNTRRYAKRQMTWIRGRMAEWARV